MVSDGIRHKTALKCVVIYTMRVSQGQKRHHDAGQGLFPFNKITCVMPFVTQPLYNRMISREWSTKDHSHGTISQAAFGRLLSQKGYHSVLLRCGSITRVNKVLKYLYSWCQCLREHSPAEGKPSLRLSA